MPRRRRGPGPHGGAPRGRGDGRAERSRRAILGAGRRLLDDEGPEAVTHLRISELTGIARTTVYRHFPEREDLLEAVLAAGSDVGHDRSVHTADLAADLVALLGPVIGRLTSRRGAHRLPHLMARAEHQPRMASVRDERVAEWFGPLRSRLVIAVDEGELAEGLDPDDAVADLVGPLLFGRYLLGRAPGPERVAGTVRAFLAAHRAAGGEADRPRSGRPV